MSRVCETAKVVSTDEKMNVHENGNGNGIKCRWLGKRVLLLPLMPANHHHHYFGRGPSLTYIIFILKYWFSNCSSFENSLLILIALQALVLLWFVII